MSFITRNVIIKFDAVLKYTEIGDWKLKITNSLWINSERAFRLFNHWHKEYKRKHVIRKPKGSKKVWFHTFYVWVTLSADGAQKVLKNIIIYPSSRAQSLEL